MTAKTTYLTIQFDIDSPKADEIMDGEADEIISEVDYELKNYEDYKTDTGACGKNDEGSL